ncbi:MAG: four helix bundle protein [Chitinophagaceae bacterium]|nr:MAG: four helix bundle protein [Chitinophagaceae bacterium]
MEKSFDLDGRLVRFADKIIDIAESLPGTTAGKHLAGQLIRSGVSPALQYAEAQSAESRADFVHKMKISLKELRESYAALRLINMRRWCPDTSIQPALRENNELIAIFVTSVKTAQGNQKLAGSSKG